MHSLILDHYTECPFDNACHQRDSPRPCQAANASSQSCVDEPTKESPPPAMSYAGRQSVLTWSPTQVLMTSPLINWTPYLATMAINPTVKYGLDLQISYSRLDSGFEDITTSSPKDGLDNTANPLQFDDTAPSLNSLDHTTVPYKAANMLPDCPPMGTSLAREPPFEPNQSSSQTKHSSTSSSIVVMRPHRVKHAEPTTSKPGTPQASRPCSKINHTIHNPSNPRVDEAIHSIRAPPVSSDPNDRHSTRSTESPNLISRPPSSRRSSTLLTRRTASRTDSFILSRNEARPIDLASVVQRTLDQEQFNTFPPPEETESDAQSPAPSPQNSHDHPLDWTLPDSRAAKYAEIDRKNRGVTGLWRKLRRRMKLGKREIEFYEGGSDLGSVRRYRLDPNYGKMVEQEFNKQRKSNAARE